MEQSTAQRRLVKSRPELWAQISDEAALGRRLAQFGAIRITGCDPETTVAWEGERASGTVELAAAGLGTTVTLTAGRASPSGPGPPAQAGEILDGVLDGLGSTAPRSPSRD
jgi:hypothetical protein